MLFRHSLRSSSHSPPTLLPCVNSSGLPPAAHAKTRTKTKRMTMTKTLQDDNDKAGCYSITVSAPSKLLLYRPQPPLIYGTLCLTSHPFRQHTKANRSFLYSDCSSSACLHIFKSSHIPKSSHILSSDLPKLTNPKPDFEPAVSLTFLHLLFNSNQTEAPRKK